MRRGLVLLSVMAVVGVIGSSAAQAAIPPQTVNLGQLNYDASVQPVQPSGTITATEGTQTSTCNGTGLLAVSGTPICTTRTVRCPVTSSGCSIEFSASESVLLGLANIGASGTQTFPAGPFGPTTNTCPAVNTCYGDVTEYDVPPGGEAYATYYNTGVSLLPILSGTVTMTPN